MNQRRVARVDCALKMLEGRVEVSSLRVVHRELESLNAKFGLCRAIRQQLTRAREIAHHPVRACEQFTSEEMLWIAIERLVGPHDHVIVPTLIPERDGNQHVGERRRRVAFESLQFQAEIRDPGRRALPSRRRNGGTLQRDSG